MSGESKRNKVFISYARANETELAELLLHLEPWVQVGHIEVWTDRSVETAALWEKVLQEVVDTSLVAVALVTPEFAASEFIRQREMPALFAAAERGELGLTWLHWRDSAVFDSGFTYSYESATGRAEGRLKSYQGLNDKAKPIGALSRHRRSKALERASREIRRLAAEHAPQAVRRALEEEPVPRRPERLTASVGAPVVLLAALLLWWFGPPQPPWQDVDATGASTWVPQLRCLGWLQHSWRGAALVLGGLAVAWLWRAATQLRGTRVIVGVVAIVGMAVAIADNLSAPSILDTVSAGAPAFRAAVICAPCDDGLVVGTPRHLSFVRLPAGVGVTYQVRWTWHDGRPHQPLPIGNSELWTAGDRPEWGRCPEEKWPRRSLFVIHATDRHAAAQHLAASLLDHGSADRVLLVDGAAWQDHLDQLVEIPSRCLSGDQVVAVVTADSKPSGSVLADVCTVVTAPDLDALADALNFRGVRSLASAWASLAEVVQAAPRDAVLSGLPERFEDPNTKLLFVRVPGGTFEMGPVDRSRPVVLAPFWISAFEVSRALLDGDPNEDSTGGKLAANRVSWSAAAAFCRKVDCELPTAAQWERAARAGATTPWCFGSDAGLLASYAWYSTNSGFVPHEPGKKQPNAFGLYDMHGNVAEWCGDWFGELGTEPAVEPTGAATGELRELRGGSYADDEDGTRVWVRLGEKAGDSVSGTGFRCVKRKR